MSRVTKAILLLAVSIGIIAGAPFVGASLEGPSGDFILWQLRVPRVLAAAAVGASLAGTGAAFQLLFANPLATPSTIGTTAGASLGVLAVLVLGVSADVGLAAAAFSGAVIAGAGVVYVASRGTSMQDVLLAGIAVSLAASALATGLQATADQPATFAAVRWSLGHLGQIGYTRVIALAAAALIVGIGLASQGAGLSAMTRGEQLAATQGVSVARLRVIVLGLGSVAVGVSVAFCGPIAFVGLMVPHAVRGVHRWPPRGLIAASMVAGAGFLVGADTLARTLLNFELPVGALTAALGAPTLILILLRKR